MANDLKLVKHAALRAINGLKDTVAVSQGLAKALKSNALEKISQGKHPDVIEIVELFCPKCGHKFGHVVRHGGRNTGALGGAAAGAAAGAKFGIAAGPLGAIAGTIPGAVIGAFVGMSKGAKVDQPKCSACGTTFEMPH
jgi:hypothetical protein